MIVVKVGGSLFDQPALGPGLRSFLAGLAPAKVVLVPGGGAVTNAVRELDRIHGLGEEVSHWLALGSLRVSAALLEALLEGDPSSAASHVAVLDPLTFAREDEAREGALPHCWRVTSDSIAARAAVVFRADRLILLKSIDLPTGMPWLEAAANGWVDAHFPVLVPSVPCPVEVVNFRLALSGCA
jgi:aspartokinase-like uncharacterized kinase